MAAVYFYLFIYFAFKGLLPPGTFSENKFTFELILLFKILLFPHLKHCYFHKSTQFIIITIFFFFSLITPHPTVGSLCLYPKSNGKKTNKKQTGIIPLTWSHRETSVYESSFEIDPENCGTRRITRAKSQHFWGYPEQSNTPLRNVSLYSVHTWAGVFAESEF